MLPRNRCSAHAVAAAALAFLAVEGRSIIPSPYRHGMLIGSLVGREFAASALSTYPHPVEGRRPCALAAGEFLGISVYRCSHLWLSRPGCSRGNVSWRGRLESAHPTRGIAAYRIR